MIRMRHVLGAAVVAAAALCGCEQDHVHVTVEPKSDGSFVRTLRLWHTSSGKKDEILPPPAALVDAAKPHYAKALESKDAAVSFQGTFRTLPPDLAAGTDSNHGGYTVWSSPLGQLGYYRERRPGRTDLYARFREAGEAADLLIRYLTAIARQQLAGEQGIDRLVEFIDGPLRKDLKDALYYLDHVSLTSAAAFDEKASDKTLGSAVTYLAQFAEERGYCQTEELLKLRTQEGAVGLVTDLVAKKMGRPLDGVLRTKIAALADGKQLDEAHKAAIESLKMTPDEFDRALKPITEGLIRFGPASSVELRTTLVLPPQADLVHTSGRHDEKAGRIVWDDTLDDRPVTALYFALWTTPAADWQTKHLGRVALRGEKLQDEILWENSLPADRAAAWRAALERLDPKGDLPKQLSAIRLGPPAEKPATEEGADILIEALKEPKP